MLTARPALQGTGMILGMGDTGLDFEHCLFFDSNIDIPYTLAGGLETEPGTGILYYQNATHRKVGSQLQSVALKQCLLHVRGCHAIS
jgi:hypothetical protein